MYKLKNIIIATLAAIVFVSCATDGDYESVDFKLHTNCERKEPPQKLIMEAVYSESEFNSKYFYAVSDNNKVNFSSEFVVAVCCAPSTEKRDVKITEVLRSESALYIKYKIENRGKQDSATAPCSVASISNTYAGCEIAFYDVTGME